MFLPVWVVGVRLATKKPCGSLELTTKKKDTLENYWGRKPETS